MNKVNLKKMAEFLKTVPPKEFTMADYKVVTEDGIKRSIIGYLPMLFPEDNLKDTTIELDYFLISIHYFGFMSSAEWYYIFSTAWKDIDDTPIGAVDRIQEILNGKFIKENYHYTDEDIEFFNRYFERAPESFKREVHSNYKAIEKFEAKRVGHGFVDILRKHMELEPAVFA